jgi:hypothetical protein
MGKKNRVTAEEQRAFDERTRMIHDYIERLRLRVEARRGTQPGERRRHS